jgi:hypothetical protein
VWFETGVSVSWVNEGSTATAAAAAARAVRVPLASVRAMCIGWLLPLFCGEQRSTSLPGGEDYEVNICAINEKCDENEDENDLQIMQAMYVCEKGKYMRVFLL